MQRMAEISRPQMQCCARALQNCTAFTSSCHLRLYVMRWAQSTINLCMGDCVCMATYITTRVGSPALVATPVVPLHDSDVAIDGVRVLGIDLGRTRMANVCVMNIDMCGVYMCIDILSGRPRSTLSSATCSGHPPFVYLWVVCENPTVGMWM